MIMVATEHADSAATLQSKTRAIVVSPPAHPAGHPLAPYFQSQSAAFSKLEHSRNHVQPNLLRDDAQMGFLPGFHHRASP
jgi:hypothetical protein